MEYLRAFIVGGLICTAAQIPMEKTKMLPGRIMVLLVVTGAVLGCSESTAPLPTGPSRRIGAPSGLWKYALEGSA